MKRLTSNLTSKLILPIFLNKLLKLSWLRYYFDSICLLLTAISANSCHFGDEKMCHFSAGVANGHTVTLPFANPH